MRKVAVVFVLAVLAPSLVLAWLAVRSLRDQQQTPFEVTPELETWLLEAANSPTSPLTHEDFNSIRERVRNRIKSAKS